ncbi:MAG TPA: septum site-determining protein MinC, partial [Clostridia bacterium]|nr:septum site-determining protein MinC [Clostridia bacterium]
AAAQHHILPQLRLQVDLQNRACGLKTLAKLEKDLRKVVGDNLGIANYRIRGSKKETPPTETALIIARDLARGEVLQTTKDVVVIGSIPEGSRVETMHSCFVFGSIRGTVIAGTQGIQNAIITCLEVAGGASLSISGASAIIHLAPAGMRSHYYVVSAVQGRLNVETRFLE